MLDSNASYSFITEFLVKSHFWLIDSTELLSIRLATGSEVILSSMYNILEVFYYVGRHAITQCTTCQNTPNLSL